jgi:hypothetical protein
MEGKFTDAEKGQSLSFLEGLLHEQPWRAPVVAGGAPSSARIVTFLTDSVHIVFFQCIFSMQLHGGKLIVKLSSVGESAPLLLRGTGGAFLAGLVCAEPSKLGYAMPACVVGGNAATLHTFLGMGATACGFAATWQGEPVVAKMLRLPADSPTIDAEEAALKALHAVPGVVKLVAREGTALLLKPLGVASYSLSAQHAITPPPRWAVGPEDALWHMHEPPPAAGACAPRAAAVLPAAAEFCSLVDALALMHAAGWVHRDPRPVNFFRTASGAFFIADLGSSVAVGAAAGGADDARPFGFTYGPDDVLRALAEGVELPAAQPAHDMEQVARLVYAACTRDGSTLPVHTDAAQLLAWWERRESLELLAKLLPLARAACAGEAQREAFKAAIRTLLL